MTGARIVGAALAIWVAACPVPSAGETRPVPGPGDPHVQSVAYDAAEVVVLEIPTGYQTTLQFPPDERIENVAVGDAAAWQASANRRGDYLFVKAVRQGVQTNMVVVTDVRVYTFTLAPAFAVTPTTPFTIRFTCPPVVSASADAPAASTARGEWKLSGARRLFPGRIVADADAIVVTWDADAPLPAVYGVDVLGQERLVNAMIHQRRLELTPEWSALVFRLGNDQAVARPVGRPK